MMNRNLMIVCYHMNLRHITDNEVNLYYKKTLISTLSGINYS